MHFLFHCINLFPCEAARGLRDDIHERFEIPKARDVAQRINLGDCVSTQLVEHNG